MTAAQDPFTWPATPQQRRYNHAHVGGFAAILCISLVPFVLDPPTVQAVLLPAETAIVAAYMTSWAVTVVISYYIWLEIASNADQTVVQGSDETVQAHDYREFKSMMAGMPPMLALQGVSIALAIGARGYWNLGDDPVFRSLCVVVLVQWTVLNVKLVTAQQLFMLYVLRWQPEGVLERPFWQPTSITAQWRRCQQRRGLSPIDSEASPLVLGEKA